MAGIRQDARDKKGNSTQIARGKVDSLEKLPRYKRKIIDVAKPANAELNHGGE